MMNKAYKEYVLKLLAYGTIFSQLNITGICITLSRHFSVTLDSYKLILSTVVFRLVGMYAHTRSKVDRYNNDSILYIT